MHKRNPRKLIPQNSLNLKNRIATSNHSQPDSLYPFSSLERGRSGIWTVGSRFQIFREWMRMPLKGTKLEKLRKEILSLNGPGQWSWVEERERWVLQGASTRKKTRVKRGEPGGGGAVWKSREVWRNLAVESV